MGKNVGLEVISNVGSEVKSNARLLSNLMLHWISDALDVESDTGSDLGLDEVTVRSKRQTNHLFSVNL